MYLAFTCKPAENYHRLFWHLSWNYLAFICKPVEILVLFAELLCTLHLLVSQLRITTGNSSLCCCVHVLLFFLSTD